MYINTFFPIYIMLQVVQVYISWPAELTDIAPKLQLISFERLSLPVNTQMHIGFEIDPDWLAVWIDDDKGWEIPTGKMT